MRTHKKICLRFFLPRRYKKFRFSILIAFLSHACWQILANENCKLMNHKALISTADDCRFIAVINFDFPQNFRAETFVENFFQELSELLGGNFLDCMPLKLINRINVKFSIARNFR